MFEPHVSRGDLGLPAQLELISFLGAWGQDWSMDLVGWNRNSEEDDVYASSLIRSPLGGPFSPSTLQEWLAVCDQQHRHIDHSDVSKGNVLTSLGPLISTGKFRLVDVNQARVVPVCRAERYVTLSYVWGQYNSQSPVTSKKAVPDEGRTERREDSWPVDLETLPRTILDSIRLVRDLHIKYIWIDGLCIDQSDPMDQAAIIPEMSAIYQNAYLTIIAGCGIDATAGLAPLRRPTTSAERPVQFENEGTMMTLLPTRELRPDRALARSRWNSRAWTYQECMFSSRCVYFTEDEVFYECDRLACSESYTVKRNSGYVPQPQNDPLKDYTRIRDPSLNTSYHSRDWVVSARLRDGSKTLGMEDYCELVEAYTKRELTHRGDRLDAFAGIYHRFSDHDSHRDAYSGLLPGTFYISLLWHHGLKRNPTGQGYLPMVDCWTRVQSDARGSREFPSWTWAGWCGPVQYAALLRYRAIPLKVPVEVTIMDDSNVLISQMPKRGKTLWAPWPFRPDLCVPRRPGNVTVHLWAKCVQCQLLLEPDASDPESALHPQPLLSSQLRQSASQLRKYVIVLASGRESRSSSQEALRLRKLGVKWDDDYENAFHYLYYLGSVYMDPAYIKEIGNESLIEAVVWPTQLSGRSLQFDHLFLMLIQRNANSAESERLEIAEVAAAESLGPLTPSKDIEQRQKLFDEACYDTYVRLQ